MSLSNKAFLPEKQSGLWSALGKSDVGDETEKLLEPPTPPLLPLLWQKQRQSTVRRVEIC